MDHATDIAKLIQELEQGRSVLTATQSRAARSLPGLKHLSVTLTDELKNDYPKRP